MKTLAAIDVLSGDAVLVARLVVHRDPRTLRPELVAATWCPACRACHDLPWDGREPHRPDALGVVDLPAGCRFAGQAVLIALDPANRAADKATHAHHRERLRAWRRERELAGTLVEPPRFAAPGLAEPVPAWN